LRARRSKTPTRVISDGSATKSRLDLGDGEEKRLGGEKGRLNFNNDGLGGNGVGRVGGGGGEECDGGEDGGGLVGGRQGRVRGGGRRVGGEDARGGD